MSEDSGNKSSKGHIRTFAMDLAEQRAGSSHSDKNKKSPEPEIVVEQKNPEPEVKIPKAPKIDRSKLKPIPKTPEPKPETKVVKPKNTPVILATPIPKPKPVKTAEEKVVEVKKEKEKKSPEPKKIPAFHELKKNKKKPEVAKVTESEVKVTENSTKKSGGFLSSLKRLFKSFSFGSKQRKTPTYTVPDTSRRKGVIQKATSHSGAIFTADNEELKESIRKRQARENEEEENEPETSWSPYTETGYNLLESDQPIQPDNVSVEFKNHSTPTPPLNSLPEEDTNETPEVVVEEEVEVAQPEEIPEPQPEIITKTIEQPVAEKVTEQAPEPVIEPDPEPAVEAVEEEPALVPEKPVNTENLSSLKKFSLMSTNSQSLALLAIFTAIFVVATAVNVLINVFTTEPLATIETAPQIMLISADQMYTEIDFAVDTNLLTEISDKVVAEANGLIEIAVVDTNNDEVRPEIIFSRAQLTPPASLIRSVNSIRFVANDISSPAILMSIVDRENVYGDMLKWEESMAGELSPLFLNDSETLSGISFRDHNIEGVDIRSLESDTGEVFVYGLIDDNTLLIAKNAVVFTTISNTLKNSN